MTLDIAELRRLEAEAIRAIAEYRVRSDGGIIIRIGDPTQGPHQQFDFWGDENEAALYVAMRNALPELLAKAEAHDALVEENERLREVIDVWKSLETGTGAKLGGRDVD